MKFYTMEELYNKLFSMRANNVLLELEELLDGINGRQAFYEICKSFAKLIIKYRNENELLINYRSESFRLINMIKEILQNQKNIDAIEFYNAISYGVSTLVFWVSEDKNQDEQYKFEKEYVILFSQGSSRSEIQEYIINSIK